MKNSSFKVFKRDANSNQKRLRKLGQTPGIIYGEFLKTSIPIQIPTSELEKLLKTNNSGSIIPIELDGKTLNCVVKEVQKNTLHEILHVDLQYTKPNEVIKMRIPVRTIGQEALEFKKLVLETYNSFIDLQGSVEKIPEYIEIDVSEMKFEDKIFVEDVSIPEDVTVLTNPKTLLAVVNA
ncbi:50S ribosomal protein L25 [Clostridium cadaveris]|uniref:50S ribosomal protein L25 n=1 Tax=Clostridium cadaveris TaxID=1529 RepID=UPI001459414D|nr:50S ribosomal protein L25 [Clostridium cadaveris]NME64210.1 50S ribosomal protein L25 [Clostridium cadaveris]